MSLVRRGGLVSGLLINAKERLRVYRLDEAGLPTLEHEFKDDVNRCTWRQACFSYDGELVAGGRCTGTVLASPPTAANCALTRENAGAQGLASNKSTRSTSGTAT